MSLAIPRPVESERASVLLPTVTCSSCAAPIPLSSLGEHVCRPASSSSSSSRASGSRTAARPSQLTIPTTRASPTSPLAQSSTSSGSGSGSGSGSNGRRPFAGPTSVSSGSGSGSGSGPNSRPSPSALSIPSYGSPARIPSPLSAGLSSGSHYLTTQSASSQPPRQKSPTNPFFPSTDQGNGTVVHGLGLGVGASREGESPYPTDRQLPAGINVPGVTDGAAGMAGVGRRAFAAAAWGVRAGVAMAQSTAAKAPSPVDYAPQVSPMPSPYGYQNQQTHLQQQQHQQHPQESSYSSYSPIPPPQSVGMSSSSQYPNDRRTPSPPSSSISLSKQPSQSSRDHIPPAASLANRPSASRKPSASNIVIPERSSSSMSQRSVSAPGSSGTDTVDHRRKESASSVGSSSQRSQQSGNGTGNKGDESISQLLKARAGEPSSSLEKKQPFFEKYKQFVADGRASPAGIKTGGAMTSSPENLVLRIEEEEDDEEESALPWARSRSEDDKPLPITSKSVASDSQSRSRSHSRQPTLDSSSSHSSSSSRSGMNGGGSGSSGTDGEELVTPSQSWEGSLIDRVSVGVGRKPHEYGLGLATGAEQRDVLEQIGEEDEDGESEQMVFGGFRTNPTLNSKSGHGHTHVHSESQSQPPKTTHRPVIHPEKSKSLRENAHVRSRTAPDLHPSSSATSTSTSSYSAPTKVRSATATATQVTSSKRTKQCQNCLEIVGGTKRFVERDGVVLCEKDWKKLYLPSCRRCHLPIEKSAVSSSDGQLKGKWHKDCFSCTKCSKPFEGDSFYVLGGKPWCQYHYHEEK